MRVRYAARLRKWLPLAALGAGLWLFSAPLLRLLAPFALAFVFAAALEGPVRALGERGLPRRVAAGLLTVLGLSLLVLSPVLLCRELLPLSGALLRTLPGLISRLEDRLAALEGLLSRYAAASPESFSSALRTMLASAEASLNTLPAAVSARLFSLAAHTAHAGPDALLFVVTLFLGTYFTSESFPRLRAFAAAQLSEDKRQRCAEIAGDLRATLGGWLRAELILALLCFCELLLGFAALGIRGAAPLALLIALIDALPVFGTGAVLVPWALCALLLDRAGRAAALLGLWALTALGRNLLQARLLGDRIGLPPLLSLLALYLGWRLRGVWGMIVFPLLFAMLRQLNDRGILRLWVSSS